MKVLFLSKGDCPDYMNDMVYHGLMSNPEITVEEINPCNYMHDSFAAQKGGLYGRGFTVFARLSHETSPQNKITIDEMQRKVYNKYYDYIIYASIHRYDSYLDYISSHYEPSKILIIDGEDHPFIGAQWVSKGTYFKRELQSDNVYVKPISFAVPKELVLSSVPEKTKPMAHIIAGDTITYIYANEQDYYADYQTSVFGHTKQKCGWDCCRHYEILMNGCIPYFEGLDRCPPRTMINFPKTLVLDINKEYDKFGDTSRALYIDAISILLEHTRRKHTTEALVNYLLS